MKRTIFALSAIATVMAIATLPGCVEPQVNANQAETTNAAGQVTTNTSFTTNYVVNETVLGADCLALESATTLGMSIAIQKDPALKPYFAQAVEIGQGVLSGVPTNAAAQIAARLGEINNPVVVASVANTLNSASKLEQGLLAKYGTNNAVIIGTAVGNAFIAGASVVVGN